MGECEMLFLIGLGVMAVVAALIVGAESFAEAKVIRRHEAETEHWREEADECCIKYACEKAKKNQLVTVYETILYGNEQKEIADGAGTTDDERAKV